MCYNTESLLEARATATKYWEVLDDLMGCGEKCVLLSSEPLSSQANKLNLETLKGFNIVYRRAVMRRQESTVCIFSPITLLTIVSGY